LNDPQALRDLQQLGEDLRLHMPELLKWRDYMRSSNPEPPAAPQAPAPPHPPQAPEPPRPPMAPNSSTWGRYEESEAPKATEAPAPNGFQPTVDLVARMRQIAEELGNEDLDSERRQDLLRELTDLTSGRL